MSLSRNDLPALDDSRAPLQQPTRKPQGLRMFPLTHRVKREREQWHRGHIHRIDGILVPHDPERLNRLALLTLSASMVAGISLLWVGALP
jgi:hypothetical protein